MANLSRRRAERRQRRYHRAFRIAAPAWNDEDRALLAGVLTDLTGLDGLDGPAGGGPAGGPGAALPDGDLATAATSLWRAQRRLAQFEGDGQGTRQVRRYLRATEDALRAAGVIIQDHDGIEYHPGLVLEVKAWVDRSDLKVDTVLETVRPSLYAGDRLLQMGQVIVGCPAVPEPAPDSPEDSRE
jgi:hypothetical protein